MSSKKKLCIGAIVASRFSSSRLPGKAMLHLKGHSIIGLLLQRLATAKLVDKIILATSDSFPDEIIASEARKHNIMTYRGSLQDVLGRYTAAANKYGIDIVVRLTGDNPFICGRYVDSYLAQINCCLDTLYTTRPICPKGLNVEILSTKMLNWLNQRIDLSISDREHVTQWLYTYQSKWKKRTFAMPFSPLDTNKNFSIDTIEDYHRALNSIDIFEDATTPSTLQILAALSNSL